MAAAKLLTKVSSSITCLELWGWASPLFNRDLLWICYLHMPGSSKFLLFFSLLSHVPSPAQAIPCHSSGKRWDNAMMPTTLHSPSVFEKPPATVAVLPMKCSGRHGAWLRCRQQQVAVYCRGCGACLISTLWTSQSKWGHLKTILPLLLQQHSLFWNYLLPLLKASPAYERPDVYLGPCC